MKINNKYFGEIEYAAEEKLRFSEGLFGFEEQKEFLPIPFEAGSDALICLQSLEDEDLSFVLLNPFLFFVDYDPKISEDRPHCHWLPQGRGHFLLCDWCNSRAGGRQYGQSESTCCGKCQNP